MIQIHPLSLRMSSAFLVENERWLYLVDAGSPGDEGKILEAVQALDKDLRLIFITHAHFDHYGSAAGVRSQTGAQIAIHRLDAQAMAEGRTPIRSARGRGRLSMPFLPLMALLRQRYKTPADILLQDGGRLEEYGLPAYLLHTPGHTPGSSSLIVENDGQPAAAAFAGDLVTAGKQPRPQRLYADDWAQMSASLERLQALKPALVYAGHGTGPISGEVFQGIKT